MECIPRTRRRLSLNGLWSTAVITLMIITLAACGSSEKAAGTHDPGVPTATMVTPLVAQRGDTVTITGSNFGSTARSVLIGGSPASVNTWTDTKITAVIGSGTPNGPQELTVHRKEAAEVVPGFFVGVAYSGEPAGLQPFVNSLEGDTAVLLGARAYPLGAAGLKLDRISLYGRGEGKTTLSTGVAPAGLQLLAGHQETLVLADLSVATDSLLISNSLSAGSFATQAANSGRPEQRNSASNPRSLTPFIAALQQARQQASNGNTKALTTGATAALDAAANAETQVTLPDALEAHVQLRNITLTEIIGGGIGTSMLGADTQMLFAGSVHFENATVNTPGSLFTIYSSGDIGFLNTMVAVGAVEAASVNGALSVDATQFITSGSKAGLLGDAGILLLSATDVQATNDSQFSSSGNIELLAGTFAGLSETLAAGQLLLSNSRLSAGSDQLAEGRPGEIVIITDNATLSASSSVFTATSVVMMTLDADAVIVGSQINLGAAGAGLTEFFLQTHGELSMESSTVTATSSELSVFGVDAFAHVCTLNSNTFELLGDGAGGNTAAADVWISCSGFTELEQANLTLTDNTFSLEKAGDSNIDLGVNLGSLTGSGNQIEGASLTLFSSEPGDVITFNDNKVSAAGYSQGMALTAAGTVTLERNLVAGGGNEATALYVINWDQLLLDVRGNTFEDFTQALYFEDQSGAAQADLTAVITDNDFLFSISRAPQVAWLEGLAAEATIDASGNRWGSNNDAAELEGFVWQNNTTAGITLAPLKVTKP